MKEWIDKMYIKFIFKNDSGEFDGKEFTGSCEGMPKLGDLIEALGKGNVKKIGKITKINVPQNELGSEKIPIVALLVEKLTESEQQEKTNLAVIKTQFKAMNAPTIIEFTNLIQHDYEKEFNNGATAEVLQRIQGYCSAIDKALKDRGGTLADVDNDFAELRKVMVRKARLGAKRSQLKRLGNIA